MQPEAFARPSLLVVRLALERVGPAWFTSVMGTGILAICLAISPVPIPFGRVLATVLWALALLLFALATSLWALALARRPRALAESLADPVRAQVFGAPPMACFTIAVGFVKIGSGVLPLGLCIAAAQTLFVVGSLAAVASAFVVPYLMFTRHALAREGMDGSRLLPVVPPIVASVPAALLSPTWPAAFRGDMLALAFAMLGMGLALAALVIVVFFARLAYHKVPEGALVTTMWLVVGPLGQSIAGFIALANAARDVWPASAHGLVIAALAYGVLAWGFAVYWLAMALATTLRAARRGMPFALSWWAFTFPVGVLAAGTDALAAQTHATVFSLASLGLVALLATTWALVATRSLELAASTTRDAIARGSRARAPLRVAER